MTVPLLETPQSNGLFKGLLILHDRFLLSELA